MNPPDRVFAGMRPRVNLLSGGARGSHGSFRIMLRPFRFPSGLPAFAATTNFLRGLAQLIFVLGILGAIFVSGAMALAIAHFSRDLPDQQQLLSYQPATGTKIYG